MDKLTNKDIPIYSYNKANSLLKLGYTPTSIAKNNKYKGMLVFYFKDENEIRIHLK